MRYWTIRVPTWRHRWLRRLAGAAAALFLLFLLWCVDIVWWMNPPFGG